MSQVDQLSSVNYASDVRAVREGVGQQWDWPELGIVLALILTVAWDFALVWLAVYLCRILFF
jgi:phage shock protein PspC (stress-responsive transcriptional regulator)